MISLLLSLALAKAPKLQGTVQDSAAKAVVYKERRYKIIQNDVDSCALMHVVHPYQSDYCAATSQYVKPVRVCEISMICTEMVEL